MTIARPDRVLPHRGRLHARVRLAAARLVEGIGSGREQDRLIEAILRLGSTMGLDTVAEGIELETQRDALRALKCPYGQGFLYSRPVPADEIDSMLVGAQVA